jgi:hypothetical protein
MTAARSGRLRTPPTATGTLGSRQPQCNPILRRSGSCRLEARSHEPRWPGGPDQTVPGHYGIDTVIPAAADATKWNVYQVKKYTQSLTPGQKTKIVESFGRALVGMLRRSTGV